MCTGVAAPGPDGDRALIAELRGALLRSSINVPDGQPLVWALHALGHGRATRVYGPDLMAGFCARAAGAGTPIYLYGGRTPEAVALAIVAEIQAFLADRLPQARSLVAQRLRVASAD